MPTPPGSPASSGPGASGASPPSTGGGAPAPRCSPLRGIAVLAATLALALLGVEAALRWAGWRAERRELLDAVRLDPAPVPPGAAVTLGGMIRVTGDERVYALRPGLREVVYEGARVSTDARGFRTSGARAREGAGDVPPPGGRCIVGLGDSVDFGQGVEGGETYLAQLGEELRARGVACETFNLGVPGYNTAMEVAALRAEGLALEPELVVLGFVENDLALPRFLLAGRDWLSPRFSILLERLGLAGSGGGDLEDPGDGSGLLRDAPMRGSGERLFGVERNPERVPAELRDRVGWPAVERALDELRALSAEQGFRVVFLVHRGNEITRRGLELARARGFAIVDLAPVVERYLEKNGYAELLGSPLTVSATDPHPSRILHALASRALLQAIEADDLLGRDAGQSPPR